MGGPDYSSIVVGGGFFGASLAAHLAGFQERVLLVEREPALLQRASYSNQARVHNGYHYPRSLLTALRSRMNFDRFVDTYRSAIVNDFAKYYAVGRVFSSVTAAQFKAFCERIGAPLKPAPGAVGRLFNPDLIEAVFEVREYAFDSSILRQEMDRQLDRARVEVRLQCEARKVRSAGQHLAVTLRRSTTGSEDELTAGRVFNCTYSGINELLRASELPPLSLKFEATEMALVHPPKELEQAGITVMCGPFFSVMPFPTRKAHTLSHVRYTPHFSWDVRAGGDPVGKGPPGPSRFLHMVKDASRYLPCLSGSRYVDSLWETKTILPASEADDSRPILFKAHHGLKNLFCVMGGKIDNVFDVLQEIDEMRARGELS
ncbi:amino acid oxidase [Vitiosangium sp. GDMCC 1.1324]|nr:amino acid oxidase [Vitiosangium sp. GDMCC 1.1324]